MVSGVSFSDVDDLLSSHAGEYCGNDLFVLCFKQLLELLSDLRQVLMLWHVEVFLQVSGLIKKSEEAIECIDAIKSSMDSDQWKGYLKGNVQKYVWRYEVHPNGKVQSLEKAKVYLQWLIEAES